MRDESTVDWTRVERAIQDEHERLFDRLVDIEYDHKIPHDSTTFRKLLSDWFGDDMPEWFDEWCEGDET